MNWPTHWHKMVGVLAATLLLASCSNAIPTRLNITGTWVSGDGTELRFYKDGSCSMQNFNQDLLTISYVTPGRLARISVERSNCTWTIDPHEQLYGYYSGIHLKFRKTVIGNDGYVVGYDSTEQSKPVLTQMVGDSKYLFKKSGS